VVEVGCRLCPLYFLSNLLSEIVCRLRHQSAEYFAPVGVRCLWTQAQPSMMAPFEGAEDKQAFITRERSAPSNGAGGDCTAFYKHLTPPG